MNAAKIMESEITPALAGHQQTAEWGWKDLARTLYAYDRMLRDWFCLDLPRFVIRLGRLRGSRYGHFRAGCNEFAVAGEIAINTRYVDSLPFGETIGTLHHEQLHLWQQVHGRPGKGNYHNRQYQRKAAESGLIVDARGSTRYDPDGRFVAFLREHGIEIPTLPAPAASTRLTGNSKLKKWSCSCTNVWAAVPNVAANCLRCGQAFSRQTQAIPKRGR